MLQGKVNFHLGDCVEVMKTLPDASFDSCVTDPPYHLTSIVKRFGGTSIDADGTNEDRARRGADGMARLSRGFMGQKWDGGDIAFRPETWREVWRVLKPGAYLAAFSGTRTYHRMVCAIEDAGFEIRDQLAWVYGSGFPKSHDVSKGIDKMMGAEREIIARSTNGIAGGTGEFTAGNANSVGYRADFDITAPASEQAKQWQGWGTALKPAWEPVCLARKPLAEKTVAANVLKHGTGAINVDGCRVGWQSEADAAAAATAAVGFANTRANGKAAQSFSIGKESRGGENTYFPDQLKGRWPANLVHDGSDEVVAMFPNDAARFFYCAKASRSDRGEGNNHPTVKPTNLMQWLCRLVTPPSGRIIDPFMGSGSTGRGAVIEGFSFDGIELSSEYMEIAKKRIDAAEEQVKSTQPTLFER